MKNQSGDFFPDEFDFEFGTMYFVEISVHNNYKLLRNADNDFSLTEKGKIVEEKINLFNRFYADVFIAKYTISPCKVYLILCVDADFPKGGYYHIHSAPFGIYALISHLKRSIAVNSDINPLWKRMFNIYKIKSKNEYESICIYMEKSGQRNVEELFL